jgi:hypothetical protein
MLRGFLVIFILCGIAILAVFGFRGQKSTAPPTEVFPDMVRQMKVRAQAPLGLFADGRGPRLPVAGTVPIGYEMPKPGPTQQAEPDVGPWSIRALILVPAPITSTLARWAITGEQASGSGFARADGARTTAFQHNLRNVSRRYCSR